MLDAKERRNFDAHGPALVAVVMMGKRYSEQHGGVMDFWDTLTDGEKYACRIHAEKIRNARLEHV